MENFRMESEISGLRGDVVFVGAAIVGVLLLNAFILVQIANDLNDLKKVQRLQVENDMKEDETSIVSENISEKQPVSEQQAVKETKTEGETKTENEKQ